MGSYSGSDKRLQYLFGAVSAIVESIANEYDSTQTYTIDSYVIYQNVLYKCTSAVINPEPFDDTKWSAVLIVNEMGGGGGGTTVIANPAGTATDTLNKLQVGATIYSVSGGGGGGSHNYSLNEQAVGTWTDGATIYEKTFIFTPTAYDIDIDISSLNVDKLIRREGCFSRQATATMIQQKAIEYRTETNSNPSYGIMAEVRNANIHINIGGYTYSQILEIRLTIQYTKAA